MLGMGVRDCDPVAEEVGAWRFLGLESQPAYPNWWTSDSSQRACLRKQHEQLQRNSTWGWPLASTWVPYVHSCICTQINKCRHTQDIKIEGRLCWGEEEVSRNKGQGNKRGRQGKEKHIMCFLLFWVWILKYYIHMCTYTHMHMYTYIHMCA